ncbi:MAG: transcriptional repressor [Rhodobacteraceae bacterium]|nr:transcriptional repressor [Paracoccaceae bacterium]
MTLQAEQRLRAAGLRPTRQRVALAEILFAHGDRHVSAETLHSEAAKAGVRVSPATVYNTLNQFTAAGLVREVAVSSAKRYFDTKTSSHHHLYFSAEDRLEDISSGLLAFDNLPSLPEGKVISGIDVLVRLDPVES